MLTIEAVDGKVVLAVAEGCLRAAYPLTSDQARAVAAAIEAVIEEIETWRSMRCAARQAVGSLV